MRNYLSYRHTVRPNAMSPATCFMVLRHQAAVEAAFEALSTITDVTVSCDGAPLCGDPASTCTVEFLTELGDVPIISHSVSNVDSVTITEFQVSPRESGEWLGCADLRERSEGGQRGHTRLRLTALFSTKGDDIPSLVVVPLPQASCSVHISRCTPLLPRYNVHQCIPERN